MAYTHEDAISGSDLYPIVVGKYSSSPFQLLGQGVVVQLEHGLPSPLHSLASC